MHESNEVAADELLPSTCDSCGTRLPRALMALHRDWHATQDGRGTRFFEVAADEPWWDQLLTVVAGLWAEPAASARPEFVAGLRDRLMAEARARSARHE